MPVWLCLLFQVWLLTLSLVNETHFLSWMQHYENYLCCSSSRVSNKIKRQWFISRLVPRWWNRKLPDSLHFNLRMHVGTRAQGVWKRPNWTRERERMSDSSNHLLHFLALSRTVLTVQIRLGDNTIVLICVLPQIHQAISSAENPHWQRHFLLLSAPQPFICGPRGWFGLRYEQHGACVEPSNLPWKSVLEEGAEFN